MRGALSYPRVFCVLIQCKEHSSEIVSSRSCRRNSVIPAGFRHPPEHFFSIPPSILVPRILLSKMRGVLQYEECFRRRRESSLCPSRCTTRCLLSGVSQRRCIEKAPIPGGFDVIC